MRAEYTDLDQLRADLAAIGPAVSKESRRVVSRGALNVKKEWADNARRSGGQYAGRLYPRSISYDISPLGSGTGWEAVIGPRKDRPQGPLGNLLEFGSVNNPPHLDGARALDSEHPRFVQAVEVLGAGLLDGL